jgi:hypothetical protein
VAAGWIDASELERRTEEDAGEDPEEGSGEGGPEDSGLEDGPAAEAEGPGAEAAADEPTEA